MYCSIIISHNIQSYTYHPFLSHTYNIAFKHIYRPFKTLIYQSNINTLTTKNHCLNLIIYNIMSNSIFKIKLYNLDVDHEDKNSIITEDNCPNNIKSFFDDLIRISQKYNISIAHEDSQGAFILEKYKKENIDWIHCAHLSIT